MSEWRIPSLSPRDLFKWGTVVFVLVVYVLIIITFVLTLIGTFG